MNKSKKITLAILAVLVSATLIMIAIFSGTLAKYISTGFANAAARAAKWGISVDTGSDLNYCYTTVRNENNPESVTYKVEAKTNGKTDSEGKEIHDNVVVPGTAGSLAWFYVHGKPETEFDVRVTTADAKDGDTVLFNGFYVGDGFYADSRMVRDDKCLPIEYFPIIIEICVHDADSNGNVKSEVVCQTHSLKKLDDPTVSNYNDNNKFLYTSLSELVAGVNRAIPQVLKSEDIAPNTPINRYYSVNWRWNFEGQTTYQNDDYDTYLCAAIANCEDKSMFDIGLKMNIQVSQSQGTETETSTESDN